MNDTPAVGVGVHATVDVVRKLKSHRLHLYHQLDCHCGDAYSTVIVQCPMLNAILVNHPALLRRSYRETYVDMDHHPPPLPPPPPPPPLRRLLRLLHTPHILHIPHALRLPLAVHHTR